jgi:hypothetical protein
MSLYTHSPIRLHGVVLNYLSTGTTLLSRFMRAEQQLVFGVLEEACLLFNLLVYLKLKDKVRRLISVYKVGEREVYVITCTITNFACS